MMRWNSAKTYTEEDMLRMQQEAVDRVREFQQRSREATGPSWAEPTQPEPLLHPQPLPLEPVEEEAPLPPDGGSAPAPIQQPLEGLLERLGMDGETALVVGLLLLLYNEKADNLLLLALAYLLF